METAAKGKWESKASEWIKCPIQKCKFGFKAPRALTKYIEERLYAHLYKYHRKPEIIEGILILAGLKEDLEE